MTTTDAAAAMILNELGDEEASRAIEESVRRMLGLAALQRGPLGVNRKAKRYVSSLFNGAVSRGSK